MIGFEHAWAFVLVVPWTLLVLGVFGRQREALDWLRERMSAKAFERVTVYARVRPRWHFLWLWGMGALLVAAATGPYTESLGPVKREARDIVLIVDASLSMLAPDARPHPVSGEKFSNRLEAAKAFCLELVDALPEARFAVVSFSGSAAIHSPITVDRHAVRTQLESLRSHRATQSTGSEFGQALGTVIHMWRHREHPLQVVLLSDGDVSAEPEPFDAQIDALANLHIPVHTVVFGGDKDIAMDIYDPVDVAANKENPGVIATFKTRRDGSTLSHISSGTDGEVLYTDYKWVNDLLEALESVPARTVSLTHPTRKDLSWVLVSLFAILFIAESRVFRRKLPVVAALLLAVPWLGCSSDEASAHRLNEEGRERFTEENWEAAGAAFEQSSAFQVRAWVPTHNLAMVHERRGMYAESHRLMEQAILMDPDFVEGFFGDGAVLYEWGQAEFHLENCRAERTRELWTRSRERFAQAEARGGFLGSLGERAASNREFLEARLEWLTAEEEKCASAPDAGADGGSPDAGGDGGMDGGSPDGGMEGGADGGGDAGTDGGGYAGSDGGADGGDAGSDGGADGGDAGADGGDEEGPGKEEPGDGGEGEGSPDGGVPSSGAGEGENPAGGLSEDARRRIAAELGRVREQGEKNAGSWQQVRETQLRLGGRKDGGLAPGSPPIKW